MKKRANRRVIAVVVRQKILLAVAGVSVGVGGNVFAQAPTPPPYGVDWVGTGTDDDYTVSANWTAFDPAYTSPYNRTATDKANNIANPFLMIGNGGTANINSTTGSAAQGAFLNLGMRSADANIPTPIEDGHLVMSGGTLTLGELRVGGREVIPAYITGGADTPNGGGTGSVVQTGGTVNITYRDPEDLEPPIQSLYVGDAGLPSGNTANGSYSISGTDVAPAVLLSGIAADDSITIGTGVGTVGTFNQAGESNSASTVTSTGFVSVGRRGATATYNLSGGTLNVQSTLANTGLWVGDGDSTGVTGSTGTFNQTGGAVNVTKTLDIGRRSGTGIYTMSDGTITTAGINIGGNAGNATSDLMHGVGTFNLSGGDITNTGNMNCALASSSITGGDTTGTLNMSGGTLTMSASNAVWGVGNGIGSVGTLNLSGGTITMTGATAVMDVGRNKGGNSLVKVSDAGTLDLNQLNLNSTALVATRELRIEGGTVNIKTINNGTAGGTGGLTRTVNISGGTTTVAGTVTGGLNVTWNLSDGSTTLDTMNLSNTAASPTTVNLSGGINNINNITTNASLLYISGGTNTIASGTSPGTFSFSSGSTLKTDNDITLGSTITLGNATANVNSGSLSLTGPITTTLAQTLTKIGPGTLTISGAQTHVAGSSFTNSDGILYLNADGTANLNINANSAGGTNLGVTQHLNSLNVGAGGLATIAPGASKVLVTNVLNIAGGTDAWTGKLDVTDNDAIIHSDDANRVAKAAEITNQLKQGANFSHSGEFWTGQGIVSSLGGNGSTSYTAVGVAVNDFGLLGGTQTGAIYSTFDGQPVGVNDVLVKYTYFGDADLDGAVTTNDYFQIDNGFLGSKTGWINGDFDYDGAVTTNDYFLIDNAFLGQGAAIVPASAGIASALSGVTAVPEPASLGLLGFAAAGLLRRRRNR